MSAYKNILHRRIYLYFTMSLMTFWLLPEPCAAAGRARVSVDAVRPLSWECVKDAAREHGLPLAAMVGILATEGGRTGEALSNTNGTWDLGPYQVNTCHVDELLREGLSPDMLLRDGCANAYAAAWILRKEYDRTRNIWDAMGAYHSRTPHLRDAYLGRVRAHLARLQRTGLAGLAGLPLQSREAP